MAGMNGKSNVFIDNEIRELVLLVREHQRIITQTENAIYHLKAELSELLEIRGIGWSDDDGYACLTPKEHQISYNTRALDEIMFSDPFQYGWLEEHRSEIPIPQRVHIR
jgi:hypothetical protein